MRAMGDTDRTSPCYFVAWVRLALLPSGWLQIRGVTSCSQLPREIRPKTYPSPSDAKSGPEDEATDMIESGDALSWCVTLSFRLART